MSKHPEIYEIAVDILYDINDFYKRLTRDQVIDVMMRGGFADAVELAKKGYRKINQGEVVTTKSEIKIYQEIYDFMKEKEIVSVGEMKTLINFALKTSMLRGHIVKEVAENLGKVIKERIGQMRKFYAEEVIDLHYCGIGESEIDELVGDLVRRDGRL
jgi:uncharacterized protein YuzB (UPF0349 family)